MKFNNFTKILDFQIDLYPHLILIFFPIVVDIVQNVCLINMGTADIYGSVDPFQRMPKSPRPGFGDGSPSDFIQRVDLSNYR